MLTRRQLVVASIAGAAGVVADAGRADAIVRSHWDDGPLGSCIVIGDSLSNGNTRGLLAELVGRGLGPVVVDCVGNRAINKVRPPFGAGRVVVDKWRMAGFDPAVWVVALGGNDFADFRRRRLDPATEITALLDQIDQVGQHKVGWPTIYHRASPATSVMFNQALVDVGARRANLVVETAWAPLLESHQHTWMRPDGIHLRGGGVRARIVMLADLAVAVAEQPACPASGR